MDIGVSLPSANLRSDRYIYPAWSEHADRPIIPYPWDHGSWGRPLNYKLIRNLCCDKHLGMPRKARIDAPGALHHVIVRGIERMAIFRTDDDRDDFLTRVGHIFSSTSTACYAWALMSNHVHMLVRTGIVPLATLMRRLLTGYAGAFNRRHRRHGHLFQNRYKSILCQEDAYLRELTRYIHLNPLRAGIVESLSALDRYPHTGHSVLMGKQELQWQETGKILGMFHDKTAIARNRYRKFVEKGIDEGERPELVGGGLIRSLGGWKQARMLSKADRRVKGDERILGDNDFVLDTLKQCDEALERQYQLAARGIDLDAVVGYVARILDIDPKQILSPGKYPKVVEARSLFCYWAVRELGMSATALAKRIGLTQPAISISVKRGQVIAEKKFLKLDI